MTTSSSSSLKRLVDDVTIEIRGISAYTFPDISSIKRQLDELVEANDFVTEDELEARTRLAKLFVQAYADSGRHNLRYLQEAIGQYETALDRLPPNSPRQTECLSSLSEAYLSMFLVSDSDHDINEAVRFGRLARQQAETTGLSERDLEAHRSILIINIDALKHLGELLLRDDAADAHGNMAVLDILNEVVECVQGIRTNASVGSEAYLDSLRRLIQVLIARASLTGSEGDREEAARLIQEVQSTAPPGSELHVETKLELGWMAALVYSSSGELGHLDDAIMQIQTGLDDITAVGSSGADRPMALSQLALLYGLRYSTSHNISDLHEALHLSHLSLFAFYPVADPVRGGILLRHLKISRELAYLLTSEHEIKEVLQDAHLHLWRAVPAYEPQPSRYSPADDMSDSNLPYYVERGECERLFCDMLGRRYLASRKLEHINHTLAFIHNHRLAPSNQAEQFGAPLQFDATAVNTLTSQVRQLVSAPPGPGRNAGADAVHERLRAICEGMDFVDDLLTKTIEAPPPPDTSGTEASGTWSCAPGSTRATHHMWAACCSLGHSCQFFTSCHASTATGISGLASVCSGTSLDCCTTTIYQRYPSSTESWSAIGCAQQGCETSIMYWETGAPAAPTQGLQSESTATRAPVLQVLPLPAGTGARGPNDAPHTASVAMQGWILGSSMILAAILAVWLRRRNGERGRRWEVQPLEGLKS
ncbi:hypothetical protein B0T18DRAFT_91117 [Schizothecium vesticola]|uniref:Uncharacterized protein n=1 Tax=Schizothecium vesticola TaxID=314040 RepID=A0AA40F7F4_9PEZI|nr:hypothetical protein B0T18DRAFT_91117 [Schizothecium vesticola]